MWQKRYTPFGGSEEQSGTIQNTYQFTGKGWDEDAGLFYFSARWYDAEVGRFISEDPLWGSIWDPQSLNRFAYGRNNPYKYTDPSGKFGVDTLLSILGKFGKFFFNEMVRNPLIADPKDYIKKKIFKKDEDKLDTDGDGIPDSLDKDDDNDGIKDEFDSDPKSADQSNGLGDYLRDSDRDGQPDCRDCYPNDPLIDTDAGCNQCPTPDDIKNRTNEDSWPGGWSPGDDWAPDDDWSID